MFGLVVAAKPSATDVLPTPQELDTQLTNNQATWSTLLTRVLDSYVDPLFAGIPATPVAGAPGGGPVAWNTEAQIRKVMTDPASVTFMPPPVNTLPLSKADVLDFKLRRFQRPDDVLGALDTYLAYVAAGRSLAPALTATKNAARRAMRDLVALEAFLVRYSAAINAAAAAGMSLAETLALYRVEGDLVAPMSEVHLLDRMPINEKIDIRYLGPVDTGNVRPTLRRALWSYPFKVLAPQALGIPEATLPAAGPARTTAELRAKSLALVHWMLVIGGLDFFSKAVVLPIDSIAFRFQITIFMDYLRTVRGLPSARPALEAEVDAVIADLTCTWPPNANGRMIVAPNTPVRLASFALTQAMVFFQLDHTQGGGPFIEPHPDLKYLAYNLQHKRSNVDKTKDRFIHVLASAAVAAAKSTRPTFAPLKAGLTPLGLPSKLPKDPISDSSDHVAVFDKLTAAPTKFLDDATNSGLLADFILRAEHADWTTFEANRGNLARFRKLLAFYRGLLA